MVTRDCFLSPDNDVLSILNLELELKEIQAVLTDVGGGGGDK